MCEDRPNADRPPTQRIDKRNTAILCRSCAGRVSQGGVTFKDPTDDLRRLVIHRNSRMLSYQVRLGSAPQAANLGASIISLVHLQPPGTQERECQH